MKLVGVTETEGRAIFRLSELHSQLPEACFQNFAERFRQLRDLFERFEDRELHEGALCLIGQIDHVYDFFLGGLQQISEGNPHVFSACARGLIEGFGALVLIEEKPDSIPQFLEGRMQAGKIRSAAERGSPGLKAHLKRLDETVHPSRYSIHAGFRGEGSKTDYTLGPQPLRDEEARSAGSFIVRVCRLFCDRLERIISRREDVLTFGKVLLSKANSVSD